MKGNERGHGILRYIGDAVKPQDGQEPQRLSLHEKKVSKISKKDRKQVWYGVELIEANAMGICDGTFNGYKWFECPEDKAVFVRRKEIKKYTFETTLKHAKMLKMV